MSNEQTIWTFLKNKGLTDYAVAGIMGNLQAESGMRPNNLEDTKNNLYGISDIDYTSKVDSSRYTGFTTDSAGYGIAQWTTEDRKGGLYVLCKTNNKSIADLECQLIYLYQELIQRDLIDSLNKASTIKEASTIFLKKFEIPLDSGTSVQNYRASLGEEFYNQFKDLQIIGGKGMKYSSSNAPLKCIMTNSTCFKQTRSMDIKGVLWHSTGANNPNLKRYVQPLESDSNYSEMINLLGKNTGGNDWNHIELQAGLNAWIGKLANGQVASIQTMPWNYRPWGCGSGSAGSCNDGWIQFEICEDSLTDQNYFNAVYQEACELTAYLCKMYKLNPKGIVNFKNKNVPVILCHQDSARLGLGSNHADVLHWLPKFGKSMDTVREDVYKLMNGATSEIVIPTQSNTETSTVQTLIYKRLLNKGKTGDDVKALQKALISLGYSVGSWGADGDFGNATDQAVRKFQKDSGLDDDGDVGPLTIAMINQRLNKAASSGSGSPSAAPSSSSTVSKALYRVRKAWSEPNTQVGAFASLANAKKMRDVMGTGYYVFDDSGKIVYPSSGNTTDTASTIVNPNKPTSVTPATQYSGVMLGYAAKDERGQYRGGQAGDQTGKEVYINGWYDQSWTSVLRPKDPVLAENIARQCENACKNDKIGYSQTDRNTILAQAKLAGYDMSRISAPCNCDCSSFVSAVCVCCGLPESIFFAGGNGRVTSNMSEACLATGKFTELTDMKYRNQKNYLKRGDILLNRNAHVVIVLSNGGNA